jgi:hypothetical protein
MLSTGCDAQYAFISKDGTCNLDAMKIADDSNDMCGGGYTNGAGVGKTTCPSATVLHV